MRADSKLELKLAKRGLFIEILIKVLREKIIFFKLDYKGKK